MADKYPPITQQNFDEIFKDFCERQPGKPPEPVLLLPPQVEQKLKDDYMMMFGCYVEIDGKVVDPSKIRLPTIKKQWPKKRSQK